MESEGIPQVHFMRSVSPGIKASQRTTGKEIQEQISLMGV